jgi:acetyltransferase-like isoleucine patch superfamily enzyme
VIEIILTREDANTEFALLTEWLVADGAEVGKHDVVCVVETTKASLEIEAPGAGTLVHLYGEGAEVELGERIALIAESAEELEQARTTKASVAAPVEAAAPTSRKATKKALELAALHGVDLDAIEKQGFITERDVEALITAEAAEVAGGVPSLLAGIALDGVTLPASFDTDESVGVVDPAFLASLDADPDAFRALPAEEKIAAYRGAGAVIGEGVSLGAGVLLSAPRIVLGDGVSLGDRATVQCAEVVTMGDLTQFGADLDLRCRRAYLGAGIWGGRSIRFGGGGHRDPWAILTVGDLGFVGDEAFVNVCRPVLIGREVFLTMRSIVVTHNVGHSVLEGFENRFAPVVLEDRSQVGMGTVVYAGCRVGAEAIVASNSYVVSDIPPGKLAIGVPAKVAGDARHVPSRSRQVDLGRRMVEDLHELLTLRGHEVSALVTDDGAAFEVHAEEARGLVAFRERVGDLASVAAGEGETVVLTLDVGGGTPADGVAVIDLLGRRLHGSGGMLLHTVRELCRKRGIRLEPGPWRYPGGLV